MNAIVQSGLAAVADYYRMFGYDTALGGELTVDRVIAGFGTFRDLLDVIALHGDAGELLVACHGSSRGLGLPLHPDTKVTATGDQLRSLANLALALGDSGGAERTRLLNSVDEKTGKKPFPNAQSLDHLLRRLRTVQTMRIRSLHFRACNIGAGEGLDAIHRALCVTHTEAPTALFGWTNATPLIEQELGKVQGRVFTGADCGLPQGDKPAPAVVINSAFADGELKLWVRAISEQAVEGWTKRWVGPRAAQATQGAASSGVPTPGTGYQRGGRLPLIGFYVPELEQMKVLFPGDGAAYRQHIAAAG